MRSARNALTHDSKTQTGFSLIEMMIAMTLGLLVLAGATSVFSGSIGTSSTIAKSNRLDQDLRAAAEFMARDIKRSGYYVKGSGIIVGDTILEKNLFRDEFQISANSQCLLYAYETNSSETKTTPDPEDKFGFRLSSGGAIQVRRAAAACDSTGSWENITDPNTTKITKFQFSQSVAYCTNISSGQHLDCLVNVPLVGAIVLNTVDLTFEIIAESVNESSITATEKRTIRLSNDRVYIK